MNNVRRKNIKKILERIKIIESAFSDCLKAMEDISSEITNIQDEEENCLSNIPENMEGCDRWNTSENAVDCLSDAADELDGFLSDIDMSFISRIKDNLQSAID